MVPELPRAASPTLIFVTQVYDPSHPVLGAVAPMVAALRRSFPSVVVIANEVGRSVVDPGVISLGKEKQRSRARRLARYVATVHGATSRERGGQPVVLAHMCPEYVVAAAPLLVLRRVPTMLWFAHPHDSPLLATAERVADAVLTSFPGAYPRETPKLHVIGQAIDVGRFDRRPPAAEDGTLRVLALGRMSPVKGYDAVVDAADEAVRQGVPLRVTICGPSTTEHERTYRRHLEDRIRHLGVGATVELRDAVSFEEVPDLIAEHDVLLNATAAGSGDKTVLEGMAMGRPVIVSNPSFADLLAGLDGASIFPAGRPVELADRLRAAWSLGPTGRRRLGDELRSRVVANHSVDGWASRVRGVADGLLRTEPTARREEGR